VTRHAPLIGISGAAGAGKDLLASHLAPFGYVRVAFADPLRDMALAIDPLVDVWDDVGGIRLYLSDLVSDFGWDEAKRNPEVRRFLQRLGTEGVRNFFGADTWVRLAEERIADLGDVPVVITDVRYPNEVDMVRRLGGLWVWVNRPDAAAVPGHASETSLDPADADVVIHNTAGPERLEELAPGLHRSALHLIEGDR
jgi:hypothetical protein